MQTDQPANIAAARRRIIVFARAPSPGRCKTRLIQKLGARGAARLHQSLVRKTLETACLVHSATVELWCVPGTIHGFFHACQRRYGVSLRRQPAGDLGRKMALALGDTLRRGAGQAVLVGTDCPALTAEDLRAAFTALEGGRDFVLQPAEDGGYVLIGARTNAPMALRGIHWSSGQELRQTRARLARLGLTWAELPRRWDVDTPADYRRAKQAGLV